MYSISKLEVPRREAKLGHINTRISEWCYLGRDAPAWYIVREGGLGTAAGDELETPRQLGVERRGRAFRSGKFFPNPRLERRDIMKVYPEEPRSLYGHATEPL